MLRIYVHITDDDGHVIDNTGYEVADLASVRNLVRETAAEIIHNEVLSGRTEVRLLFRVEDDAHRELLVLPATAKVAE
jgi:hypothetical protein